MKIIHLFLLVLTLFLVSCENVDLTKVSKEDVNKVIVCPEKYIRFGASCCLDKNNNQICDMDEKNAKNLTCEDECSGNICEGPDYIACLRKSDGCKDKEDQGKVKGKCGVVCLTNNDCSDNEECISYQCNLKEEKCEDECSNNKCDGFSYIKCIKKSNGCKEEEYEGKVISKCGVECLEDDDCASGEKCGYSEKYKCGKPTKKHHEIVVNSFSIAPQHIACTRNVNINVEIQNKGDYSEDVEATVTLKDVDDGDDLEESKEAKILPSNRETLTFPFVVPRVIKSGNYQVELLVKYKVDDDEYETEKIAILEVSECGS